MSYVIVFLAGFLIATFMFQSTLRRFFIMVIIKSLLWMDRKVSKLESRKPPAPAEEDFKES